MPSRLLRAVPWLVVAAAAAVLFAHLLPFPGTGRLDGQTPFTQLAAMRPALTAAAVLFALASLAIVGILRRGAARTGRRGSAPASSSATASITAPAATPALTPAATPAGASASTSTTTPASPSASASPRASATAVPSAAAPIARTASSALAPAIALAVVALASAATIAPRAVSGTAPGPDDAPGVTVLTANLLRSEVAPAVLVDLVRRTGADVLTLPETSAPHARRIARALTAARGERWRAEVDGRTPAKLTRSARPTAIVVREALGPRRIAAPADDPRAHGQVRIRLSRVTTPARSHVGGSGAPGGPGADGAGGSATGEASSATSPGGDGAPPSTAGGAGPRIAAVHPLPPWPAARQRDWRRDLRALRPLCGEGWVIAGDLNATIDHSPLRSVLGAGCEDAAAATGQGLHATWSGGPFGVVRPAIDHVLTSGPWRATSSGVLRIAGSDHRAVWARVVRQTR